MGSPLAAIDRSPILKIRYAFASPLVGLSGADYGEERSNRIRRESSELCTRL